MTEYSNPMVIRKANKDTKMFIGKLLLIIIPKNSIKKEIRANLL